MEELQNRQIAGRLGQSESTDESALTGISQSADDFEDNWLDVGYLGCVAKTGRSSLLTARENSPADWRLRAAPPSMHVTAECRIWTEVRLRAYFSE